MIGLSTVCVPLAEPQSAAFRTLTRSGVVLYLCLASCVAHRRSASGVACTRVCLPWQAGCATPSRRPSPPTRRRVHEWSKSGAWTQVVGAAERPSPASVLMQGRRPPPLRLMVVRQRRAQASVTCTQLVAATLGVARQQAQGRVVLGIARTATATGTGMWGKAQMAAATLAEALAAVVGHVPAPAQSHPRHARGRLCRNCAFVVVRRVGAQPILLPVWVRNKRMHKRKLLSARQFDALHRHRCGNHCQCHRDWHCSALASFNLTTGTSNRTALRSRCQ